jgi:hypothetical protein
MIISGWKFKRGVKEPQSIELQAKELLYCVYTNVSGICYHQILQLTIGSLTIDPAFLCGTTCRKSEEIKAIKRKNENLERVGDRGNETSVVISLLKKNANMAFDAISYKC